MWRISSCTHGMRRAQGPSTLPSSQGPKSIYSVSFSLDALKVFSKLWNILLNISRGVCVCVFIFIMFEVLGAYRIFVFINFGKILAIIFLNIFVPFCLSSRGPKRMC